MNILTKIFLVLFLTFPYPGMYAFQNDTDEETSVADTTGLPWLDIDLVDRITFRYYYMDSEYPSFRYPLVNSNGDALRPGVTPFFNIEGGATAFDRVSLYYNFQADLANRIELKLASLRFQLGPVGFEAGRGSVWMGHGYYGSLLLSNNADPFNFIRIETADPIKLPYVGSVGYKIFGGSPKRFNILGHRASWYPLPWIELSASKTIIFTESLQIGDLPYFLLRESFRDDGEDFRDARVSLDIGVRLPPAIRSYVYPIVDAKIYFEYAGENIQSFWSTRGGDWVGPFGFEFIGTGNIAGLWIATEQDEIRFEYAQNYRNRYLLSGATSGSGWGKYSIPWYGAYYKQPYVNGEDVMGHHMGSHADVIYFHYQRKFEEVTFRLMYSSRRRGLVERRLPHELSEFPEQKNQFGIEVARPLWMFDVSALFLWNRYDNVDIRRDPLIVHPVPEREASEYILGVKVSYRIGG